MVACIAGVQENSKARHGDINAIPFKSKSKSRGGTTSSFALVLQTGLLPHRDVCHEEHQYLPRLAPTEIRSGLVRNLGNTSASIHFMSIRTPLPVSQRLKGKVQE